MRRFLISLLAAVSFSAVLASTAYGWTAFAQGTANGGYAFATAAGNVDHPEALAARIASSPHQHVTGNWLVVCSKGHGAGSKEGTFSGTTPLTKHLRMPYANPTSCTVSAGVQLGGSGFLKVKILAR